MTMLRKSAVVIALYLLVTIASFSLFGAAAQALGEPPRLETASPGQAGDAPESWIFPDRGDPLRNRTEICVKAPDRAVKISRSFPEKEQPDLDFGYNDFLDIGVQLMPGYTGGLELQYVTAKTPEAGKRRSVIIPAAALKADGAPHVYRLDLGLEVWWRGQLQEITVATPPGVPVTAAQFLSLTLGDVPGDQGYTLDYGDQPDPTVKTHERKPGAPDYKAFDGKEGGVYYTHDSKHFQLMWDRVSYDRGWKDDMIRPNLRNAEEVWQNHTKRLKMKPPQHPQWVCLPRIPFTTWNTAAHGGIEFGLNVGPWALRPEPPSWVLPHEIAHVFQGMMPKGQLAGWHEAHANYCLENYLQHFWPFFGERVAQATLGPWTFYAMPHANFCYFTWPIFRYLEENPDHLPGLGPGTVDRVFAGGENEDTSGNADKRMNELGLDLKTIYGNYARRNVNWDYDNQNGLRKAETPNWKTEGRPTHALFAVPDRPGWWRPPRCETPQQFSYVIHELVPTSGSRSVSVTFEGVDYAARQSDWRASLVAVDRDGISRMSELWNKGMKRFDLKENDAHLYLAVAATPGDVVPGSGDGGEFDYLTHPFRWRFLYEVKIEGAVPLPIKPLVQPTGLPHHVHPNGGGFVQNTAKVDASAFVGPQAMVLDCAKVLGKARIEDFGVVRETAAIKDEAIVSGYAKVAGNVTVEGRARVRDRVEIGGGANIPYITGQARLLDSARAEMYPTLADACTLEGNALMLGREPKDGYLGGSAVLAGDGLMEVVSTNGFFSGRQAYAWTPSWVPKMQNNSRPGLYAAFRFDSDLGDIAKDLHGASDAILRGKPKWINELAGRHGVLTLDGRSQHLLLPPSCSDLQDFTLSLWIYPEFLRRQTLICFSGGAKGAARLEMSSPGGNLSWVMGDGTRTEELTTREKLLPKAWRHVAVTSEKGLVKLWIDGKPVEQKTFTLSLARIQAPGLQTSVQRNLIGWDGTRQEKGLFNFSDDGNLRRFCGAIDNVAVFVKPLSEIEMKEFIFEN